MDQTQAMLSAASCRRYGAYPNDLSTLAHDKFSRSEDKARLLCYIHQSRILVGCALYADILKPASLLSLTLQDNNLDVVLGIKN